MSNIIHIYKAVKEASQNEALAQAIAEAFDEADSRYPNLATTATQRNLSETELRLMVEIEKTRGEIKDTELRIVELIKETELKLATEIKDTELKYCQSTLCNRVRRVKPEKKSKCVAIIGNQNTGSLWINNKGGKPKAASPKPKPVRTNPVQTNSKPIRVSCKSEKSGIIGVSWLRAYKRASTQLLVR
jgi:hypothetical protein